MSMRLSDQDAAFLFAETAGAPMHGVTFSVVEGKLSQQKLCAHIGARLHIIPRLRERLQYVPFNIAHPTWVDDGEFDLDNHVKSHKVPRGTSVEGAIEFGASLAQDLLPRDKPLWSLCVIEGVAKKTIVVQIAHHAMMDGAASIGLSSLLFELSKTTPTPADPAVKWVPAEPPSTMDVVSDALRDNIAAIREVLPQQPKEHEKHVAEMFRRAGEIMTRFVDQPVKAAPWNAMSVGAERNFLWHKMPLGDIREIRRAFGGSINDVVLAIIAEAASRYLRETTAANRRKNLRIMCPVNIRTEGERGSLGSQVSAMFPIIRAEPMAMEERLSQVRLETESLKHTREAHVLQAVKEALPSLPPIALASMQLVGTPLDPAALRTMLPGLRNPFWSSNPVGFNFTLTNVPGSQTAQYLAGHQMLDSMEMQALGGNLGYGVAVGSYNQNLYFNFVCDPTAMPDLELMVEFTTQCVTELLQSAREADSLAS